METTVMGLGLRFRLYWGNGKDKWKLLSYREYVGEILFPDELSTESFGWAV